MTVMLLRLVDMWLNHEIAGGEFVLITGLLGWVGIYSWAKWPSLPSFFLLGSVSLAFAGLRLGERRLRIKTAQEPLQRVARSVVGLQAAIHKEPANTNLRVTLGDTYAALGLMDEALREYGAAALLLPKSYEIRHKRQKAENRRVHMLTEGIVFCAVCGSPNPKRRRFCHRCARALPQPRNIPLRRSARRDPSSEDPTIS